MQHFSLLDFTQQIKRILDQNLEPTYWIVAEIGEMRTNQKGHCYLELIETNNEQIVARIKATIWSYTYQNLVHWFEKITGSCLQSGMKILCNVEVHFHESFGLSLNIRDVDANYTLGEKQKVKQEIIDKLKSEGIYDLNHEKPLPLVPQRIAVISSASAAGYQDFLHQLKDSGFAVKHKLFNAQMQGVDATKSIVEALKAIFLEIEKYDAVALLRGGGSQSDLDGFNTYLIGKAIARFPLPIITGVGHERDETIADLVARVRLKTPTAVAEFIIAGFRDYNHHLDEKFREITSGVQQHILNQQRKVNSKVSQIINLAKDRLNERDRSITSCFQNLVNHANNSKNVQLLALQRHEVRLVNNLSNYLNLKRSELEKLQYSVQANDPDMIFKKGYSYSTHKGIPLHKVTLKKGDVIDTITEKQKISSAIKSISS